MTCYACQSKELEEDDSCQHSLAKQEIVSVFIIQMIRKESENVYVWRDFQEWRFEKEQQVIR